MKFFNNGLRPHYCALYKYNGDSTPQAKTASGIQDVTSFQNIIVLCCSTALLLPPIL